MRRWAFFLALLAAALGWQPSAKADDERDYWRYTVTITGATATITGVTGTTMRTARIVTIGAGATTATGETAGNTGGIVITGVNSSRAGRW